MRPLAAVLLFAFIAPLASAADKDEDKVKEAALAFLKAVKSKDVDAVMKTVDVPFLLEKGEPIAKSEDLKEAMKAFLGKVEPDKIPTDPTALGKVLDGPAVRKLLEEKKSKEAGNVEKVLGKTGYAVFLLRDGKERGGLLVRMKDGKTKVVGLPG